MSWSWVDTEYSIHRVQEYTEHSIQWAQHPPKIVCLPFILQITSLPLNAASAIRRASLHDQPPSASSPFELKGKVTWSHSHGCELTNWWIQSQHPARRPSIPSKNSSKLARLRPPRSHDHGPQMHLQTRSITASKCISQLPWLRPPNSLNHGVQVHLQTHSITASQSISTLKRLWPAIASPNSHDHSLQVHLHSSSIIASKCISKVAQLRHPNLLDHGLQFRTIVASKCIFKYAPLPPPSVSPNLSHPSLKVYLWVQLIVIFRCISNCSHASPAASPDIPCVDG